MISLVPRVPDSQYQIKMKTSVNPSKLQEAGKSAGKSIIQLGSFDVLNPRQYGTLNDLMT